MHISGACKMTQMRQEEAQPKEAPKRTKQESVQMDNQTLKKFRIWGKVKPQVIA